MLVSLVKPQTADSNTSCLMEQFSQCLQTHQSVVFPQKRNHTAELSNVQSFYTTALLKQEEKLWYKKTNSVWYQGSLTIGKEIRGKKSGHEKFYNLLRDQCIAKLLVLFSDSQSRLSDWILGFAIISARWCHNYVYEGWKSAFIKDDKKGPITRVTKLRYLGMLYVFG